MPGQRDARARPQAEQLAHAACANVLFPPLPPVRAYAIIPDDKRGWVLWWDQLRSGDAMHTITLYAKAGCHLCDEARDYLEDLAAEQSFALDEIDIRSDDALFERYRYRIPVIAVDGVERLEGRIASDEVRGLLDGARGRP